MLDDHFLASIEVRARCKDALVRLGRRLPEIEHDDFPDEICQLCISDADDRRIMAMWTIVHQHGINIRRKLREASRRLVEPQEIEQFLAENVLPEIAFQDHVKGIFLESLAARFGDFNYHICIGRGWLISAAKNTGRIVMIVQVSNDPVIAMLRRFLRV